MKEMIEESTNGKIGGKTMSKPSFWKRWIANKVLLAVVITVLICGGGFGLHTHYSTHSRILKIGFENIGEMATQVAYCREVHEAKKPLKIFKKAVPFTESKQIYSYIVIIKAGFDFNDLKWKVSGKTITVNVPEIRVLDKYMDTTSLEVYSDQGNIFSRIKLEDINKSNQELVEKAMKGVIRQGLFDKARENAETVLKGFFGQVYNLNKYEIVFKHQIPLTETQNSTESSTEGNE